MRQISVYGKPGCHLCEDALALLDRLGRQYPMVIQQVDITTSPDLFRRYDTHIPVIVIDEQIELEAPISERALRDALASR